MTQDKLFNGVAYSAFIHAWWRFRQTHRDLPENMFSDWLETITIKGEAIPSDVIAEIVELNDSNKYFEDIYWPMVKDIEDFCKYINTIDIEA